MFDFVENVCLQIWQLYGFSPVCDLWCVNKLDRHSNCFPHWWTIVVFLPKNRKELSMDSNIKSCNHSLNKSTYQLALIIWRTKLFSIKKRHFNLKASHFEVVVCSLINYASFIKSDRFYFNTSFSVCFISQNLKLKLTIVFSLERILILI